MFFLKRVKFFVAQGGGGEVNFSVLGIFKERQKVDQYGTHQSLNYSRNSKANASYSVFIQIIIESSSQKSNMHGSEASTSHFLIRAIMRRAPAILLSKFI